MKNKIYFVALLIILNGCNSQNNTEPKFEAEGNSAVISDYVAYYGPINEVDIKNTFKEECSEICVLSSNPDIVPLKKLDKTPICIDSSLFITFQLYLTRQGDTIGAECQINKEDYDKISNHYKINNIYKQYANQREIFDQFRTWKSHNGFVTTYREIDTPDRNDNNTYRYKLYVGKNEHPYRSKY